MINYINTNLFYQLNLITILIWYSLVIPELPQIKSSSDERTFGGRMMWRVIKGHVNRDCIRRIPNVSQMTQKKALPPRQQNGEPEHVPITW